MTTLDEIIFPVINDKIAPSSTLAPVSTHRFPSEPRWKQGIVASDPFPDMATKEYLAIADYAKLIATIAHNESLGEIVDAHLYEILPEDRPVRPYFDLEWDSAQLDEVTVLTTLIPIIFECLHTAGFKGGNGIALYTASGSCGTNTFPSGNKSSFHLLIDTYEVFLNVFHHKRFIDTILLPAIKNEKGLSWMNTKHLPKLVVDKAPYSKHQAFRLPQQSKHVSGVSRPLVLYDCESLGYTHSAVHTVGVYEDPSTLTLIRVAESQKPAPSLISKAGTESVEFHKVAELCTCLNTEFLQDYESTRNLIWMMWALEQTDRMRDLIHSVCRRGRNYEWKWVEEIMKGLTFRGFTVGSLVKWARDAAGNAVNDIIAKYKDVYYQELFQTTMKPAQHRVINQRYLGQISFEEHDTMMIRSHLGTGKTHSITRLIAHGDYQRILIVSPRKSYTTAQVGEFEVESALPHLQSYLDLAGPLYHIDYLILQVESLHRIGEWFEPYDLVILDESESILCQLHSTMTHGDYLISNHQVLELAVKTAKHVILADAFMTDRTFHFTSALREPSRTMLLENTYQPYTREAILLKTGGVEVNMEGLYGRIMTALRAGQRIVVVWTSKRIGEEFEERFLKKEAFTYLFYHSDTTKEEQLGLKNVEESWSNIQCLMMTTSITVGISYDPRMDELEYDEAFLYGTSTTALPRDIAQSLLRVRVLKANRLTYVTNIPAYAVEECGFTNVCNLLTAKEDRLIKEHPLVKWARCPTWARWNHAYNENERRCSCTYYKDVLEKYLVNSGYELKEELEEVTVTTEEVQEEKHGVEWGDISDITREQAEEIQREIRKGDADRRDKLSYQKYAFREQFASSVDEEVISEFWEKFVMVRQTEKFWNVVLEKRMMLEEMVRGEARRRFAPMVTHRIKRREALERFLGILGLTHSQEAAVLSHEQLVALGEPLQAADKVIREGMGLRASQRKGEWKVGNTMDLIRVILEEWGGGTTRSERKQVKNNEKVKREYTLYLNEKNVFWDSIKDSNTKMDDFIIKL
jgi:hypothetical protein